MNKMHKNLLGKLHAGTKIISNSFIFPDWRPYRTDTENHVYLYVV